MLTNVRSMRAAVRGTAATPLAASTASVLKAANLAQMAKPVMVRWTDRDLNASQTQTGFL